MAEPPRPVQPRSDPGAADITVLIAIGEAEPPPVASPEPPPPPVYDAGDVPA